MGAAEVLFELNTLIDHAGWHKLWLQFCRLSSAPKDVVTKDMTTGIEGADARYARGRLAAYVYHETKNAEFGKKAWNIGRPARYATTSLKGPDVLNPIDEVTGLSTNSVSQSSLETIELLAMCGDLL